MRYRIHVDSPRHRVHNEYFVEFKRTDLGQESVHTEPDRATWLDLNTAQIALRRLRAPEYRIRCRLLDEYGSVRDDFADGSNPRAALTLHNAHENLCWRDKYQGVTLEIPIVMNKAYDPPRYYFKFATGPVLSVVDGSIQGSTPLECFEKFVTNPRFAHLLSRFRVEDLKPEPAAATPVAPQSASVPSIKLETNQAILGIRPGSVRP